MKQITLLRRDNPERKLSPGVRVNLLSADDDFNTTVLKTLLQPNVQVFVGNVEVTHTYECSNLKEV